MTKWPSNLTQPHARSQGHWRGNGIRGVYLRDFPSLRVGLPHGVLFGHIVAVEAPAAVAQSIAGRWALDGMDAGDQAGSCTERAHMAKQKGENTPRDPEPKVVAAIANLRQGYEVGRKILQRFGEHAEPGQHLIEQAGREYNRSADSLRKWRQFALEYTKRDLDALCKLCLDRERALGVTFIFRLVAIKNKRKREEFQRMTIVNHWGFDRFARELRRFKLGYKRGRKALMPEGVREALAEIEEKRTKLIKLAKHSIKLAKDGKNTPGARQLREVSETLLAAIGEDEPSNPSPSKTRK